MAKQVQYRGSARSIGFSPQQVSDAAISRMREESNRVIQGMRTAAEADISQRERISREVRSNQQAEQADRQRNFDIQTRNQNTEMRQMQMDAQTARNQLEINQNTQSKIFESISEFSETATKKYEEIQEAKSDELAQQAVNEFLLNPTGDAVIQQILGEYDLAATEEARQSELDVAQAKGGNPLAISKARALDSNGRYKLDQARTNYILTNLYPQQLNKALLEAGDLSAAETAAFVTNFQRDFIQKTNILAYKPEMIRDGLAALSTVNQSVQTKAQNREIKLTEETRYANATTILTQNPAGFVQNAPDQFSVIRRQKGSSAALDWYEGLATARGVDGEYLFTLDQIASVRLNTADGQVGKTFAESNPGRMGAIKIARERGDTQYRTAQVQADELSYKEDTKKFLKGLTEDGSKANAEAAVQFFRETYGRVPESIQKYANSYTYEAVAKAKSIEEYEAIPDGFITQEAVDALSGIDPEAARVLSARFVEQQKKYTTGTFKDQSDSFKTIANGVTSFGSNKPNTPASVFLQGRMRAEYRKRVDLAVAGGLDFNTAASTIGMQLADEVKNGARDPNSLWYRKPNQAGGGSEFPNLNGNNLPALEKANRRYKELLDDISDRTLPVVLRTPESIITQEEAVAIMNGYGKPGFTIPRDVAAIAGMRGAPDPFTIINAQLEALDLPPLDPPQITKDLNANVSPEFQNMIYDAKTREAAKRRALEQGVSQTSGNTSAFQRPGALRSGSQFKRSFTGAMMYSENPQEYVQAGSAFQDLGFKVAEHPAFGGTAPVHSSNSYHGYGEAFDITHWVGTRAESIEKTRQLKEAVRSLGLFEEIIGPGDDDPNHESHLHLGGLMRPITQQDIDTLKSLLN